MKVLFKQISSSYLERIGTPESAQVSFGKWNENQERYRICNNFQQTGSCQGTMWTHGAPQEEGRVSKKGILMSHVQSSSWSAPPSHLRRKSHPRVLPVWAASRERDGPVRLLWFDSTRSPNQLHSPNCHCLPPPARSHSSYCGSDHTPEVHRCPTAFSISTPSTVTARARLHISGCQAHQLSEHDQLPGNLASPVPRGTGIHYSTQQKCFLLLPLPKCLHLTSFVAIFPLCPTVGFTGTIPE